MLVLQVKELREKLDSTTGSLTETQSLLRDSEEKGKELETKEESVSKELMETTSKIEELKVRMCLGTNFKLKFLKVKICVG